MWRKISALRWYISLTKPKIVLLVIWSGVTALVTEGSLLNSFNRLAGVLLGTTLVAGAANAFNQVWDSDIDAVMVRTRNTRPIPNGKVSPAEALIFSVLSGIIALFMLLVAGNLQAAALGLSGMVIYMAYTIFLKRRTPVSTVIGGVSGACAPLICWVAGSGSLTTIPLLIALIIFFWSPPHFWSLALFRKEDYVRTGIPMLPVVAGEKRTRIEIAIYTALLLLVVAYLGIQAHLGWIYFGVSTFLGMVMAGFVIRLLCGKDYKSAQALFRISIIYLPALFCLIIGTGWLV
jgi:protoheme IX farnesyltransferase